MTKAADRKRPRATERKQRTPRTPRGSRAAAAAEPAGPNAEERILDAAHRVFLRRGSAGARTQEIADEAGVNKALLHYYFRTKERLAAAVFKRAAARLLPPVIATLTSEDDLETKVARVIEIELDVLLNHPYLPGYIISEITHNPARARDLV